MFGPLGLPELILIFVVALIIFGPKKLPDIGRSVGRALGEFKKASNDLKTTLEEEVRIEEQKSIAPASMTASAITTPDSSPVEYRPTDINGVDYTAPDYSASDSSPVDYLQADVNSDDSTAADLNPPDITSPPLATNRD